MQGIRIEKSSLIRSTLAEEEIETRHMQLAKHLKACEAAVMLISNAPGNYRTWLSGQNGFYGGRGEGYMLLMRDGTVVLSGGMLLDEGVPNDPSAVKGALHGPDPIYPGVIGRFAFDAQDIESEIRRTGLNRIALVHPEEMSLAMDRYLLRRLPGVEWVDVTQAADGFKMIKSSEELRVLRRVVGMHEKVFAAIPAMFEEGMLESELVHKLRTAFYLQGAGFDDQAASVLVDLISCEAEAPLPSHPLKFPGRRIRTGDRIDVRVRSVGDDEYTAMLARSFTVGPASPQTKARWAAAVAAQDYAAKMLRPGVTLRFVADQVNAYLAKEGFPGDATCFLHGVGLGFCEIPALFTKTENLPLMPAMVLAVEPMLSFDGAAPLCCGDVYRITKSGCERLGDLPRMLIEV